MSQQNHTPAPLAKNGFGIHGIDHLSPSSINHFLGCPASWVAERLLKRKGLPGAAMHRGVVVEDAISAVLMHGQAIEDAKAAAVLEFDKRCAMLLSDHTKEREAIPKMIDQGIDALLGAKYGAPIAPAEGHKQHKVSLRCGLEDGTAIEFIGYLDFAFPDVKKIVDLKTTMRCPSSMSFAHVVQRCIYDKAAADGWSVEFLYVTPKKTALLADADTADVLATVKAVANRMNRFLKLSADPMELASFVPVVPDAFYWSDPAMKTVRRELFGI